MIENDILSVVLWLWATICLTSGLTLVILSFWREHHVSRNDFDPSSILGGRRVYRQVIGCSDLPDTKA
jgi:hypothetical protein